jgi:hypothetical protein
LDLPEYETYEELERKLKTAIKFGKEGFGFSFLKERIRIIRKRISE